MAGVPYGPNSGSMRPDVNMTDISGYQPWKALNDFAMHNDMDQGAFQQLVRSLHLFHSFLDFLILFLFSYKNVLRTTIIPFI